MLSWFQKATHTHSTKLEMEHGAVRVCAPAPSTGKATFEDGRRD